MTESVQVLSLSEAAASADGLAVFFTLRTPQGDIRLTCPSVDIGNVLRFFAGLAVAVGDELPEGAQPINDLVPIPCSGLGLQVGTTPDTNMLVVNISGFALAFEIPGIALADSLQRLAQTARTLSAGSQKPQ